MSIKTYKGFDKDLKCRGFQYEIGKEYEEKKASACSCGFHACEMPIEVLGYYEPGKQSRYCEVEQSGDLSRHSDDTKVASTKIKIGAEIGIPGIVKAQVEYVKERAEESNTHHSTGDWSANSATGYGSANSATGYGSANSATGSRSANSATGDWSANSATGSRSANSATGYGSANISTGTDCENAGLGERNISVAWGKDSKCKGSVGSFLVLSEWGGWDGEKYPFIDAKMVKVDGKRYKADTWYELKNGKVVKAE
jgi:hypothetical protein